MLRLTSNVLRIIGKQCLHNDRLFSGVGYVVNNLEVERVVHFENGTEIDIMESPYDGVPGDFPRILQSELITAKEDYDFAGPFFMNDKVYSGIGYEFFEDHCVAEILYEFGMPVQQFRWNLNGECIFYEKENETEYSEIHWYEAGNLQRYSIVRPNQVRMEAYFTQDLKLSGLHVEGDYIDAYDRVKALKVKRTSDLRRPDLYQPTGKISLSGEGITDELLSRLMQNSDFDEVTHVDLFNVSLSNKAVDELLGLPKLQGIDTRGKLNATKLYFKKLHDENTIMSSRIKIHP